jgi:hypothetical protein
VKSLMTRASVVGLVVLVLGTPAWADDPDEPAPKRVKPARTKGRAGVLTDRSLGVVLRNMGFAPKSRVVNNSTHYHLTVPRDTWTFQVHLQISPNKKKLWLTGPVGRFTPGQPLPGGLAEKLLEANQRIGPAHFHYNPASGQLTIALPVDNRALTTGELRYQLDFFMGMIRQTAPLWNVRPGAVAAAP